MTRVLELLEERDLAWVHYVVDVVAAAVGKPWRVALERLEGAPDAVSPRRHTAIVGAVQRVIGGRTRHAKEARRARSLVLGHPALDAEQRTARVETAARTLAVTNETLEKLLWSDLPRERPVELPHGRPSDLEVAAQANLALIQRAVRGAHAVTVRVWGDAGPLLRAATIRGLLVSPWIGNEGETVIEIIGPLALCHRTSVYGRAISGLVPLFATCESFELAIALHGDYGTYEARTRSPVLLPSPPAHLGGPTTAVSRLGRDLGSDARVTLTPPALISGGVVACPDLAVEVDGKHWYVELVGFWTTPYLERKLRGYGRENVVLCIDEARACADDTAPAQAMTYTRRVDAAALLARMRSG